jgi:hypothetical protein
MDKLEARTMRSHPDFKQTRSFYPEIFGKPTLTFQISQWIYKAQHPNRSADASVLPAWDGHFSVTMVKVLRRSGFSLAF